MGHVSIFVMRELRQRQSFKRRLYSTPALLALVAITGVFVHGAYTVWMKEQESAEALTALKTKVADLSTNEASLESEITRLNTGAGIDEAIKEKFNVAAVGEHVAVIIPPDITATSTATSTGAWYKRLWDAIIR